MADELNNDTQENPTGTSQEGQSQETQTTDNPGTSETSNPESGTSSSDSTNVPSGTTTETTTDEIKYVLNKQTGDLQPHKYFIRKINGVPVEDPYISQFLPNNLDPKTQRQTGEFTFTVKKDYDRLEELIKNYKDHSLIPVNKLEYLYFNTSQPIDGIELPPLRVPGTTIIWTGPSVDTTINNQMDFEGRESNSTTDTVVPINTSFETGKIYKYTDKFGWKPLEESFTDSEGQIVSQATSTSFYYKRQIDPTDPLVNLKDLLNDSNPGDLYDLSKKYIVSTNPVGQSNILDDGFQTIYQGVEIEANTMIFVKDINPNKGIVEKAWGLFGVPRPVDSELKPDSDNPPSSKAIYNALTSVLNSEY